MKECASGLDKDLLGTRWAFLLWWVPVALIVIGGVSFKTGNTVILGDVTRTALWTLGFAMAGSACLLNAVRCRRLHCFFTGPMFLLLAAASLLYGLGVLPLGPHGWNWIAGTALAGTFLFMCVLEQAFGKYTKPMGTH